MRDDILQTASDTFPTEAYAIAQRFVLYTDRSVFITGRAGTGKTTFLHRIRDLSPKSMAIVAPTGVAALTAGGMTIHSFFQLPIHIFIPTSEAYAQLFAEQMMSQKKRSVLSHLEMLVIDEISMVRADVLDAIDRVLRHYKQCEYAPFGGVQVVMIGDLFQLSQVVNAGDEASLMETYYPNPYFFSARVMKEIHPMYIELDHVYRQSDSVFIDLLNEVRENRLSAQGMALLRSRYDPSYKNSEDDFHIMLTTHNSIANRVNEENLDALPYKKEHFEAIVDGDFPVSIYPTDACLYLKKGARVMFIRNDDKAEHRFYNGKLGVVEDIVEGGISVRCEDSVIDVTPMVWRNIRYRADDDTGRLEEEEIGTFTQYPLRLAWAVTIHKSQGLTFDKVIVDAAMSFAPGQVYVALSRCRTLEGIVLTSPLDKVDFRNDRAVLSYIHTHPTREVVKSELKKSENEYMLKIFISVFDFREMETLTSDILYTMRPSLFFSMESKSFMDDIKREIGELQGVGERFKKQLQVLILSQDTRLRQRLEAAEQYFLPRLKTIVDHINHHPIRCLNKNEGLNIQDLLYTLYFQLNQKICFIHAVASTVSLAGYLQTSIRFVCPRLEGGPVYEKKSSKNKGDTYKITLEMYHSGLSPEEIAKKRNLTLSTIYTHLSRWVGKGVIDIRDLVSTDIIERVKQVIVENPEVKLSELHSLLNDEIDYNIIRLCQVCTIKEL